jgi:UDP-N-acetylmuramoyl-tripeptide--D-alanyl-D-alanine ligase
MRVSLKLKTPDVNEIALAVEGRVETVGSPKSVTVTNVSHDSRDCSEGTMFCAIRGERFDGHEFIKDAVALGACAVLCERVPEGVSGDFNAIVVEDTVKALGAFAKYYKSFSNATFIAVTGSVGKTTTKEFIAAVVSESFKTHKTKGNFNNEIGLPLTLLALEPGTEVAVVEMGMSERGEIEYMSRLVEPDVAVITNIGTSHLASLGTRENICEAKMEITAGLKSDGALILNADEPLLFSKRGNVRPEPEFISVYNRFGDYRAVNIRSAESGMMYDLIYDNKPVTNVEIPALGRHNVYNSLIAYAVGIKLGMSDDAIRRGLASFHSAEKRQNIYEVGDITVIDDCYNSSPESMRASLDVLISVAQKKGTAPCAMLGDMLELGEYSRLMHDQLGQNAAQMKVVRLYCFGEMADVVAQAAIKKGIRADNVSVVLDREAPEVMAELIDNSIEPGDVLLVKASRSVRAERVIEELAKRRKKK